MALLDQFDGDVPEVIETDTETNRCIHCGEENDVDWGHLDSDGWGVWRDISCDVCGTEWCEVYKMSSIINIKVGDKL